jgi:hypothetical protein
MHLTKLMNGLTFKDNKAIGNMQLCGCAMLLFVERGCKIMYLPMNE